MPSSGTSLTITVTSSFVLSKKPGPADAWAYFTSVDLPLTVSLPSAFPSAAAARGARAATDAAKMNPARNTRAPDFIQPSLSENTSARFAALHEAHELVEERARVVRARGGFRVVLHREDRAVPRPEALARAVVEVHVRELDVGRQRVGRDGEAVVLGRDRDAARLNVLHGMVRAAVAELELVRGAAEREAQELLPEADAEHGHTGLDEALHLRDARRQRFGVARPVRKEVAVESPCEELLGGRHRREHRRLEVTRGEHPQDVPLDAVVDRRHSPFSRDAGGKREAVASRGPDRERESGARHRRLFLHFFDERRGVGLGRRLGGNRAAHDAPAPEMPHEGACVQLVDAHDAALPKPLSDRLLAPRVRETVREMPRGEARDLDP